MYAPRLTYPITDYTDPHHLKLYAISATGIPIATADFLPRLQSIKSSRALDWSTTPAFAILHQGSSLDYLVLAWWSNDNELFTSVSVKVDGSWIEDTSRYSFCLWDLEVIWFERNSFVKHLYSGQPNLTAYRADLRPTITP